MKLTLFVLLLINSSYLFPTFSQNELVKVYTKISDYRQTFTIDFLSNKDAMALIKVNLEQIFTSVIDKSLITMLFDLTNWITQFFERLDSSNNQVNTIIEPQTEFNIYEKLDAAIKDYNNNRIKRSNFEYLESIAENNEFVDKNKVVGCSNTVLYGQNRVACLKKYINLVKMPRTVYIGNEMMKALIAFLNKPIPILKARDAHDFGVLLNIPLNGPDVMQELFNKLQPLQARIPTPEYLLTYNSIYSISENTPTPSTVASNTQTSLRPITITNENIVTPETMHTDGQVTTLNQVTEPSIIYHTIEPNTEDPNINDLTDPTARFLFVISEIKENELDITVLKESVTVLKELIENIRSNVGLNTLIKLESEFTELEKRIEERLNLGDNNEEDFNTKLHIITKKLDELDISDTAGINVQLRSKITELENILAQMLENNQAKNSAQNEDLILLKNDVDTIKKALSNSITVFNEEKTNLRRFLEPLNKLSTDVEKLKSTLNNWEIKQTQSSKPTDISNISSKTIEKLFLIDAINKLIVECENIKLLLSKPKVSKYTPSLLYNSQIKYVYFTPRQPNLFVVDWKYYSDSEDEYIIDPIPICNSMQCNVYTREGLGNDTRMYENADCVHIIQDEYYCKNKIEISCPVYSESCEIFDTVSFQPPKMINETHLYIFATGQTKIMTSNLPLYTNVLVSFDKDTTFKINGTEFFANAFDQNSTVKIIELKINDSLWEFNLYNIIVGSCAFGLTSLAITILSVVIVKCRKQKSSPKRMVRINNSKVYFDPGSQETSM